MTDRSVPSALSQESLQLRGLACNKKKGLLWIKYMCFSQGAAMVRMLLVHGATFFQISIKAVYCSMWAKGMI